MGFSSYFLSFFFENHRGAYCLSLSLSIMSYLRRYSVIYELYTLDACRIAVDVWSNSSRCRQESVYFSRTWCLYTWSCLDILIIIRFSINCSTVICSPTVILMLSWEMPLVKPMAPGSILHSINLPSTSYFLAPLILQSLLSIYIIKIP